MTDAERPLYTHAQLRRLLDPRRVALVGASERAGAFGNRVAANMAGFRGHLDLVNARYERIGDRPCHPSLAALAEVPDCVVIAVAREAVAPVLAEAAALGVGGAIVFASGYAETAKPERVAEQAHLKALARTSGMPIIGPNCIGIVNYLSGAAITFSAVPKQAAVAPHAIGVISQSGALGFALALAAEHGAAVSHVLTSGNSCDVDMADYVAYLADDPACRAIACLFEGMAAPRRLLAAASHAAERGKVVVAHKIAVGESGAAAALSHTGSLAGSDAAYRAAFARAGIVVVDQFEALMETAAFFAKAPPPRGSGVAVVAASGGAAIMAADKAEIHGVPLPQPAAETRAVLEARVPEFGSPRNPCDVTAQVLTDPESLNACAGALLADPAYAALVVPTVYAYEPVIKRILAFDGLAEAAGKFACTIWVNEHLEGPGTREAEAAPHTALFRSTDRCFATLAAWLARPQAPRGLAPAERLVAAAVRDEVARALASAPAAPIIGEARAKALLARYGIPVVAEAHAGDPESAAVAAERLGFPVVVKVHAADLAHKTEIDGVRLGLADAAAVRAATADVLAAAARAGIPGATALVQKMIPGGLELMLGARVDPLFGPLVVVGLGGVFVELLHDSVVDLAPVSPAGARAMLARLRGARLLEGFRGAPAVDRDRLAGIIARFSEFAADHAGQYREIDLNPLIAAGGEIVAVDALIVTAGEVGKFS
jgi:acetyl-CoA synthetase